jgi:hypothetical protein
MRSEIAYLRFNPSVLQGMVEEIEEANWKLTGREVEDQSAVFATQMENL